MLGWQALEGVYMIQGEVIRVMAGVVGLGMGVEELEVEVKVLLTRRGDKT